MNQSNQLYGPTVARQETVTHLKMTSASELRPVHTPIAGFEVRQSKVPCPELSRFFYATVGGDWLWTDRLQWTYAQWKEWVSSPGYECWIGYLNDTPSGYFELQGMGSPEVELAFFGLLPQFTGHGLGRVLLTRALERAWSGTPQKVWLHTSSFDHPVALKNYLARGFRVAFTETFMVNKPAQPIGPWPGSQK